MFNQNLGQILVAAFIISERPLQFDSFFFQPLILAFDWKLFFFIAEFFD